MKRILHNSKPRSPLGIGLFLVGALLVALSAWQGFAALSQPTGDSGSARPVALSGARFELRSIETIRPGEQVLAFDPETGEQAWRQVEHALVRATDHLRILTIREAGGSQQTIKTTDEHPFWVPDEGWTTAGKLRPGDGLQLIDGQPAEIVATKREEHPNLVTVHNLTIAGLHTYHVSADSYSRAIVVHNATCDDLAKAGAKTLEAGKDAAGKMLNKADEAADAAKRVAATNSRPSVTTLLPGRVTGELPAGQMRMPAEVKQARNFFERNREAARKWWERRTGQIWPKDGSSD